MKFFAAFDLVADPFETLETLIKLGFKRVLTSGQKSSVVEGLELLKKLQEKANGRIILIAGAGIRSQNVKKILDFCDFSEFHASGSKKIFDPNDRPNKKLQEFDAILKFCDPFEIREIKNFLISNEK